MEVELVAVLLRTRLRSVGAGARKSSDMVGVEECARSLSEVILGEEAP